MHPRVLRILRISHGTPIHRDATFALPRWLLAGGNLLRAVDDSKDVDLIRLDVVDDSKGAFEDLPNLWNGKLRDFAP